METEKKNYEIVDGVEKLEAALDSTEVPTAVYTNLIDAVHSNMEKIS